MFTPRRKALLAALALTAVAYGCEDDDPVALPAGVEVYVATLTGAAERPNPVTTTATGTATVTVIDNLLSFSVDVVDIDSVTIGHIHRGVADSAGGVMVDLTPTPTGLNFTGNVALGSRTVVDSVLTHMRNNSAYVNIHTRVNGPGEIRGQLVKIQ